MFEPPSTYHLPSPSQLRFHTSVSASVAKAFCKSEASAFRTNFDGRFGGRCVGFLLKGVIESPITNLQKVNSRVISHGPKCKNHITSIRMCSRRLPRLLPDFIICSTNTSPLDPGKNIEKNVVRKTPNFFSDFTGP